MHLPRICDWCGDEFTPPSNGNFEKREKQRYCGIPCRQYGNARESLKTIQATGRDCTACGEFFIPHSVKHYWCQGCVPDKTALLRMTRYRVSQKDWQRMLARFDGKCWVCVESPAQYVDHNHKTGAIRGPVCPKCNMALHHVENGDWWIKAVSYLSMTDGVTS